MDMGKGTIITKGCKLLLDAFQFIGISSRNSDSSGNSIQFFIISVVITIMENKEKRNMYKE
jgi:hypothetical protein